MVFSQIYKKINPTGYILLIVLFITNCRQEIKLYDLDSPVFEFYQFYKDKIIFQFNEPLSKVRLFYQNDPQNGITRQNAFPTANIRLPVDWFNQTDCEKLMIESVDTSGNIGNTGVKAPINNHSPVQIKICGLNIKYTKKKQQSISLKVMSGGDTSGYTFKLFINMKEITIPFTAESVDSGTVLTLFLDKTDQQSDPLSEIVFSTKIATYKFTHHLSQLYSLIMIINHRNEVVDYLLYYNSHIHPAEYYQKNRNFQKLKSIAVQYDLVANPVDIADITYKKKMMNE